MKLIDIEHLQKERWHLHRYVPGVYAATVEEMDLEKVPTVDAVPLEPLCEWLERNAAGRWNGLEYTAAGWKDELTRWMEEQDADRQ